MNESKKISIVVAAYNEEPVIANTITLITDAMAAQAKYDWELICVDDGSKDRTFYIMKNFAREHPRVVVLKHSRNFGQGRALRTGFNICTGDIVVTLDADLSYGPEYIMMLADALDENSVEISLASPYTKGGTVSNVPFYRYFLSRYGNKYLAKMSPYDISTGTSVVRGYRREALDLLFLVSDGMELQLEILMKSAMMGFRVHEVPADLAWPDQKKAEADFKRVSKMRILRTIRTYLLMGWLEKPANLFLILSGIMLIIGFYMAAALFIRFITIVISNFGVGLLDAISFGLKAVFATYSYSFIVSSGLILFGFQMLAFALLTLQNKFCFEQLFLLGRENLAREKTLKERKGDKYE